MVICICKKNIIDWTLKERVNGKDMILKIMAFSFILIFLQVYLWS